MLDYGLSKVASEEVAVSSGAEVTVTATPGLVQDIQAVSQPVNVIESGAIFERAKTVVAQAVLEEPGVNLLRTAPTMAGIYVRGLTGNKVNIFVDGVRYSNSAQRGGVNTFLDLLEPSNLQAVEVLRGPNSAQYGSDAMGGSVQFLSVVPSLASPGSPTWRGNVGVRRFLAAVAAGIAWQNAELVKQEKELVETFKAAGMTVVPVDIEAFRKPVVSAVVPKFDSVAPMRRPVADVR